MNLDSQSSDEDWLGPVKAKDFMMKKRTPGKLKINIPCLTYKAHQGPAASYLTVPYFPNRTIHSQIAGLFMVPRVSKSRKGGRGFSYQALLWDKLPVGAQDTDTLSTFKVRFKSFLCDSLYLELVRMT